MSGRHRKSESDANDLLQVTFNTRTISPLAKDLLLRSRLDSDSNESSPGADVSTSESPSTSPRPTAPKPKGAALKRCPCGNSSGGKSWVLKCTSCTQSWHNTCANLKGNLPKTTIDQLDHWLCPWCFVCPYEPPTNHKSIASASALAATVLSDTIVTVVEDSIKTSLTYHNTEFLTSIRMELDKLSEGVQEFAKGRNFSSAAEMPPQGHVEPVESVKEDIEEPLCDAFSCYKENFITNEEAATLVSFFEQEEFVTEGSRKVVMYGEKYHYKGSSSQSKPIPDSLNWLIEKIKAEQGLQYDLNQILVNKYEPSDALPLHSDNEGSIKPESSIFTVSLNSSGKIGFSNVKTKEKQELNVEANSLYEMSRQSQNYFKHEVCPNATNQSRYSITLRSVHWTNYNSTCAIGDSNFGRIEFGSGHGKVGTATPGIREWAPCVKDIKPSVCASYRNVVVMCGTNDLKNKDCDVRTIYQVYKGKIEQIREENQACNLFVCPVLPSRNRNLNHKINDFNWYLFNDLQHDSLRVHIVQGFNEFADHSGVLRPSLHDLRTPNDTLHINDKG